jgi:hypothetical protein
VDDLQSGATALGARGPVTGGVRRADEGISVTADTIRHDTTVLVALSPQLGTAIAHAVSGDLVRRAQPLSPSRWRRSRSAQNGTTGAAAASSSRSTVT